MKCFCEINYELLISCIAIVIALVSLFFAIRFYIISLLYSQITNKATDCNSNLETSNLSQIPQNIGHISAIISSIITFKELLDLELKGKTMFCIKKEKLKLIFYLQLHTTIREFLREDRTSGYDDEVLERQLKDSKLFLKKSIQRDISN